MTLYAPAFQFTQNQHKVSVCEVPVGSVRLVAKLDKGTNGRTAKKHFTSRASLGQRRPQVPRTPLQGSLWLGTTRLAPAVTNRQVWFSQCSFFRKTHVVIAR